MLPTDSGGTHQGLQKVTENSWFVVSQHKVLGIWKGLHVHCENLGVL